MILLLEELGKRCLGESVACYNLQRYAFEQFKYLESL